TGPLASDQCRAGAAERIEHEIASPTAVADGLRDQVHRFHGGVQVVGEGLIEEPHVTLIPVAAPMSLGACPPPVQDWLVLPLVIGAAQREVVLCPQGEGGPGAAGGGESGVRRMQLGRGKTVKAAPPVGREDVFTASRREGP